MGLGTKKQGNYLSILGSQGVIVKEVSKDTEGAIPREYEDKAGVTKTKYEQKFGFVEGQITGVNFYTNDYGTNISLKITDDDTYILSVGVKSKYGRDIMHKLPNVDFEKPVKLVPYAYEKDGRKLKGVTFYQDDAKIESHFIKINVDESGNEFREYHKDYPQLQSDWNAMTDDERDIYSAGVRKFLTEYTQQNICSKFAEENTSKEKDAVTDDSEINPDDIPF